MYKICTQQITKYGERAKIRNLSGADKRAAQL
jgi:hypothetical protein